MGNGNLFADLDDYELPGVPWTPSFTESGIAFHGTYWHDNFGTPMSRGCINMRIEDAKWLLRWANPMITCNIGNLAYRNLRHLALQPWHDCDYYR